MFTAVSFLVVSVSYVKSPGRLLLKYFEAGYDSGEGAGLERTYVARVSGYEWAAV